MSHKYLVAYESDIDVLGTRVVMIENTEVALFKLSDGTIKALENRCPHKEGSSRKGWYAAVMCTARFMTGKSISAAERFKHRMRARLMPMRSK